MFSMCPCPDSLNAPNLDDVVDSTGGDAFPIRAERDAFDTFVVSAQAQNFPPRIDVPQLHIERAVFSSHSNSRDEAPAIWTQRQAINATGKVGG